MNKLEALDLDPNSILNTFTITGTASPDGSYESNQKLASARMEEVTNIVLSVLRPDTRNFIKVTTNARVAEWNEVADLMEADGLTAEADQIKSITSKYSKDRASQALSIRRLPFYTNLLSKKYLPMLRKVEYQYEYSQFRTRTDQEILEIYKRDPQMINTRYECARLFETTQDPELLRSYYNLSLQKFPRNNYLASNRLACLNLKENKPDLNVLAKYIKEDAPQEVLQNQVVTALKAKEYQYADSVASFIYRTEDSEDLIAIVEVLNGNFDNASRILLKGGLNEVLVLLAMKQDDEALEKAKLLPAEEPINDYVRAIAFRRQGDAGFSMARAYLQNAVMWDESLGEIADMDGDLKDVWEIVKELF